MPPAPRGLWDRLAAAAVADEVDSGPELPHVDFLRRMAEIDAAYDAGLDMADGATIVDFVAARNRRRA